jgi:hypothetical protein
MNPTLELTKWVTPKVDIALALADGACGAGYGEGAIIISSVLTALAAELWPGRNQDRARFIELLVRMDPFTPLLETVSVPLLVQHLEAHGRYQEAEALEPGLLSNGRTKVVTGRDVDLTISATLAVVPALSLQLLQRFSYACLIYKELRSSYAHQYQPGERADYLPMTTRPNQTISYVNRFCRVNGIVERRVHFHVEWLAELTVGVAQNIDAKFTGNLPSRPSVWWIDQHK